MPRDSNGNYTLPAGNPVVTGTTIESAWANPTMEDIKQALTDSLDRYGRGGMQAPFRFVDGTAGAPGMSWASELSTGFYRAGAADMRATVAGVPQMRWTGTGVDVWDSVASSWKALTGAAGANFALLNEGNTFTQSSKVVRSDPAWALWKDATPTKAGRISFNISATDYMSVDYYDGVGWYPFIQSNILDTNYYGNTHVWRTSGGTIRGTLDVNGNWNLGLTAYSPTSGGVNRYLGITGGQGTTELGIFANGGWSGARLGLFAYDDGASVGAVGLDYTFSNGVTEFEFRRAGVTRFSYDQAALRLRSQPVGNQVITWQADDNGNVFWNTSAGAIGFQWYLAGVLLGALNTSGFQLFGGSAMTVNGPSAGATSVTQTDTQTCTIQNVAGGAVTRFVIGAAERFRVNSAGILVSADGGIAEMAVGSASTSIFNSTTGTLSPRVRDNGGPRGAVAYHSDAGYANGRITTSTSAAPATGQPGEMWLQVT